MQKITPFLWFNGQAEEAVNLYTSLFKDAKIISITRYPEQFAEMKGKVLTAVFQIEGQQFMAIDGGPQFKFTEAISLFVDCKNQEEVDHLWENLIADGGAPSQCGWLKDKFGLSWQIIPRVLGDMMQDKNPQKAQRVMQAMMKMSKIEIKKLEEAYHQE